MKGNLVLLYVAIRMALTQNLKTYVSGQESVKEVSVCLFDILSLSGTA